MILCFPFVEATSHEEIQIKVDNLRQMSVVSGQLQQLSGISKNLFLGEPVLLTYPTVDDIADRIIQLGPGCLLFKRDLKRAYRELPVDPFDYPLLGYSWHDKLFFDVRLPMGLQSAAMAHQQVTNAVCFMLSRVGCNVLSYLDDFMGISVPRSAFNDYALTGLLLQALGLHESSQKACPPSNSRYLSWSSLLRVLSWSSLFSVCYAGQTLGIANRFVAQVAH